MRKKGLTSIFAIGFLLSFIFMFSSCVDKTTDVAYVQFVPKDDKEVIEYTAYMYADDGSKAHIYLFENEEKKKEEDSFGERDYLLKIIFKRGLGVDHDINEKDTLVVDIDDWSSMEIRIKNEYYDSSKKVYLNGVDITSRADSALSTPPKEGSHALGTFWYDAVYFFEDFGLIKGNTSEYINLIEYK